jgi:hypothetical protein
MEVTPTERHHSRDIQRVDAYRSCLQSKVSCKLCPSACIAEFKAIRSHYHASRPHDRGSHTSGEPPREGCSRGSRITTSRNIYIYTFLLNWILSPTIPYRSLSSPTCNSIDSRTSTKHHYNPYRIPLFILILIPIHKHSSFATCQTKRSSFQVPASQAA